MTTLQTAIFNADDQQGVDGLWVTNGTASGTLEITGVVGANMSGLNPQYLTNLNGGMLFNGTDASGIQGLWVTNGTATGTYELTNISGANPAGLDPTFMQAYNGEVPFRGETGVAGDEVPTLWVTNGTAAGT